MSGTKLGLIFFISFVVLIPSRLANIAEFDESWQQRAEEAQKAALEAYDPNPEEVTDNLNYEVSKLVYPNIIVLFFYFWLCYIIHMQFLVHGRVIEGSNSTRRNLRTYNGPCLATNPIDRCWRCKKNWANNRKRLAQCVLGFGRKTTGGKSGKYYIVNDPSDNNVQNPKPGTLRHAVIQKQPLWIIFSHSMIIRLSQELLITSHKTIDARGANVHIANGAGITIQFARNVIIHGLRIHDIVSSGGGMIRDSVDHMGFRTPADGDGISIFGSTNIWLDHISMSNCQDGLIDAIQGSTAITISNCHFTHHNDVIHLHNLTQKFSYVHAYKKIIRSSELSH